MRIRSFQGLLPRPELVDQVACVPYDVINSMEAARLAEGNPVSLLHVIRPEIDLEPGINPYADAVYDKAVENFKKFQTSGILQRERGLCLYLYQLKMGNHTQTGLTAVFHVDDYNSDLIKKHEKTRPDKEDDRTRITQELGADPEPVFLTYRDTPDLDALTASVLKDRPLYDFTAADGIRHTVWRIAGGQEWIKCFEKVPVAYVADGHHRSASAARVGRERRQSNPQHNGSEDYNWFLAVIFPASQLQVLPYNRLLLDLNGLTPAAFLDQVKGRFRVVEGVSEKPAGSGQISMYLQGRWLGLQWDADFAADPVSRLDVSVLQERLLAPVLGIDDPRTSKRIDFVGGIRGTKELVKRVDSGEAAVAFSMYPVTVDQLMDIADAGQIMPPKSTWFEPKLRSGLFIHTF